MTADISCPEAEAAFLGCLLRLDHVTAGLCLASVDDDDFAEPRHRLVLAAIRSCIGRGLRPDPVVVLGELRRLGLEPSFLDDKSSGVFLAEVYAAAPVPENATFYLRIVLEHRFRRRVVETAERLQQVAGTASLAGLRDVLDGEWLALHGHLERMNRHDTPSAVVA